MEDLCKIRDVYRAIAEFETQFMQQYNLSLNEGMLLCTLLNTPRLTSGEIAEALGLTCSNTSKLIRSVEEKKLIARIIGKPEILPCGFGDGRVHGGLYISCLLYTSPSPRDTR